MLRIILSAVLLPLLCAAPLMLIYRRVKRGGSPKKPLFANLAVFCVMFALFAGFFLKQGVAAAGEAIASGTDWSVAAGYLSAAIAVSVSGLASAKAVSATACAAIGALTENENTFGKALVFVGMAEGIALYGLLVAFVIISNLG